MTSPIESLVAEAKKHCWQPIENAPKDGQNIVIHGKDDDEVTTVKWKDHYWELCEWDGRDCEVEPMFVPVYFRHLDTTSNDITAKLLEVVKVAVAGLEACALGEDWRSEAQIAKTILSRISAIAEEKK